MGASQTGLAQCESRACPQESACTEAQSSTSSASSSLVPFFILRNGVSTAGAESSAFPTKPTSSQVHSIPSQTLRQSRHADEDRKHNSFQRPDCMRSRPCCKIVNELTGGRLRRNTRHGLRLPPLVFGSTLVAEQKQTRPMERLIFWNIWLSRYNRTHNVARRNMAQLNTGHKQTQSAPARARN
jgi:hypothetical protein